MTLTFEQFGDNLSQLASELVEVFNKGSFKATQQLKAEIGQRVHNKGKAVDGSSIGKYSTSDILVGKKSFVRKTSSNKLLGSKGKRRKLEWVTINGNKLAVLEGGYKELRNLNGLDSSTVNLDFRGDLLKSTRNNTDTVYFKDEINTIKARANEKRFKGKEKTIFAASKKERKKAIEIIEDEFQNYFDRKFG